MDADEKQFAVIYPKFKEQGEQGLPVLTGEIDKKLPSDLPSSDENREKLAKRQANAAVALLKMNRPEKVWPLLKRTPPDDPRVRSYLIHRLSPLGADSGAILKRLDEEPDVTIRRALLLSLGEYDEKGLSPEARQAVLPKVQEVYRKDADPGLHAACEWLLRKWKAGWVAQTDQRRLGEGQRATGEAAGRHQAGTHEGQGEDAAAVVRQRPGPDDGSDPRPGGVPDGFAEDGSWKGGRRDTAQGADRPDVCPRRQVGDGGAIPSISTRATRFRSSIPARRICRW